MRQNRHLSTGDGVLFVKRILGEGRFADEHRPDRELRSPRPSGREIVPAVEQAAWWPGRSDLQGALPAVPQSARLRTGAAGALEGSRPVVDSGHRPAVVPGSATLGWYSRAA